MFNTIVRLLVWGCLCCLPQAAQSQEKVSVGVGIICDHEAQLRKVLASANAGAAPQAALEEVNGPEHPRACAVLKVAYVIQDKVGQVRMPQGIADIVQILVVAVENELGWQYVQPSPQFTVFMTPGREA